MAGPIPEWRTSPEPVPYREAVRAMEGHVAAMLAGEAPERVWLLEHPPLYTAGTGTRPEHLPLHGPLPVYATGRGGQLTYHGPGQRVAYVMLDLRARGQDIRRFVRGLEGWVIAALAAFGVEGGRRADRAGVWVRTSAGDAKIAALGVRVRRGITFHGISVNVAPDLDHYRGIVPCGVQDAGVTSLAALGRTATLEEVDRELKRHFADAMPRRAAPASPAPAPSPFGGSGADAPGRRF